MSFNPRMWTKNPLPSHPDANPYLGYVKKGLKVQGDQLNMAVYFWYLVKSDLSSVRY